MKTLREAADELGQTAAETLKLNRCQQSYVSGLLFCFALRAIAERRTEAIDDLIAAPPSSIRGTSR